MGRRIKQYLEESRIVNFFGNFDKRLLFYFYNSTTYKLFLRLNAFFRDMFVKNRDRSVLLRAVRKAAENVGPKDMGLLIALVTVFSTFVMILLKKEIDVFSVSARVFFLFLGALLIIWGGRRGR